MRTAFLLAAIVVGTLDPRAADEDLKPISAAEAVRSVGKPRVLVQMEVKRAKDRLRERGIIYLDSEDDPRDPNNLGVALSSEAAAKFIERGIADPATHFLGKTIRVRGCVMKFEERPYLPVHDADQITVVAKK